MTLAAAMVYHYSPAGTVDHTPRGPAYVNDWVPVRRGGSAVGSPAGAGGARAEGT